MNARITLCLCLMLVALSAYAGEGEKRDLLRDSQFRKGFHLLDPQPGKRVVYGRLPGLINGEPVWDLAQWSSRFPLGPTNIIRAEDWLCFSNGAKSVTLGDKGRNGSDLSLAVNAGEEYPRARRSTAEPWVHLLVQQDFIDPPSLGSLKSCAFSVDARLKSSTLVSTNDYSPAIHAAQFLIYVTVANRNLDSKGYQVCFWFGIPVYDNRARIVPAYEARDFGGTGLFIFTPSSDTFSKASTHDGEWVTFSADLLPLFRQGLDHARKNGFIKGSSDLADYRPLGIFIGWEVPGRFNVELEMRELSMNVESR